MVGDDPATLEVRVITELCRSVVNPCEEWLNMQKHRKSWLDRHQSRLRIQKHIQRHSNTMMQRQWMQPVLPAVTIQPPGQFVLCSMPMHDARHLMMVPICSPTIDDAQLWSTTDIPPLSTWKFLTFQNFHMATSTIGAKRRLCLCFVVLNQVHSQF